MSTERKKSSISGFLETHFVYFFLQTLRLLLPNDFIEALLPKPIKWSLIFTTIKLGQKELQYYLLYF